jgi:DNA polymerase III subunit alpha
MLDPIFVHLRLHSEYSIADGIVRIDEVVARAAQFAMPALALTDLGNLFGLVKFYEAAQRHGIKPIAGCDLWVSNEINRDQPSRILLLLRSQAGYLRLCELLSRAYRTNQHRGRAEIRTSWLQPDGEPDLIALSGGVQGAIGQALLQGDFATARAVAQKWRHYFPDAFYIELQRTGAPAQDKLVHHFIALAADLDLPVVATHPVQFVDADDFKAHEARVCIGGGYSLGDKRRPAHFTEQQYFKSQEQMAALFADVPEALQNAVEVAKRCNLDLQLGISRLPQFPIPAGATLEQYLRQQAGDGLTVRLEQRFPDPSERVARRAQYEARLGFETDTIIQMGFPGYFLIVADFINWAKQNGVPVGPGRGSGAGSLVAYALGITDLDPLQYDLLFERFLNPERVSMPDFDVDFCQDGRERVIEYVKQKYGADSVAQIATFGTMAAKAVVRDVGRVLDLPYGFVDQLAKLIPFELGMTLSKARKQEPQLNERALKEEEVAELLELAERLEGITRNVGMHAGGVLIAPGKLTDHTPLYCAEGSEAVVSQFDKDDVEKIGLVKFDFLGLRTLTILDWTVRNVALLTGAPFALDAIALDDAASFAVFANGNTTAVFQCESRVARDLGKRLKPDTFDDVIALMALMRPGPLQSGMVDDFINRKHGRERAEYFHPALEAVLKPTYGVIVYQEQVMQIAQILAGYSLGAADLLRRAMGKKKAEEMAAHRAIFVSGALERKVPAQLAQHLFDLMEKFAEYGFNKSHSAAYALVAFQTAYFKAHFPAAFMAATLSGDLDDTDKVQVFYEDCKGNGLTVLPPDINLSQYRFVPVSASEIRYGLGAVKGTGEAAVNHILRARETHGPFLDLFDFCRRLDKRIVNRRVVESLVRAGAFDGIDEHRASLLASVGLAMEAAEQSIRHANQESLFGSLEVSTTPRISLVQVPRWTEVERLQYEKSCIGFYLSGHPFNFFRQELSGFIRIPLGQVTPRAEPALLAGIVYSSRIQQTRRGRMAVIELDDGSARVEVAIFSELMETNRALIKEDQLLVVEGKVSQDTYSGGVRVTAEKLFDLDSARARYAKGLRLEINGQADAVRLHRILGPFMPGTVPVRVAYRNHWASCEVELGKARLSHALVHSLRDWLHDENVRVLY